MPLVGIWLGLLVGIVLQFLEHGPIAYAYDRQLLIGRTEDSTRLEESHVRPMPHCEKDRSMCAVTNAASGAHGIIPRDIRVAVYAFIL